MNKLMDESSLESVDILSHVFQFLNLKDLYSLQKVSPYFYRTIEYLKSLLIKPLFDVGIVSSDKEQLEEFFKIFLNQHVKNYENLEEFKAQHQRDELQSVKFSSNQIHVFDPMEKEFILRKERFRVFFYPLLCEVQTSLAHGDFSRLDGFIFLKPKDWKVFASMPKGCCYCATLVEFGQLFSKEVPSMPVSDFCEFKVENMDRLSIEKTIINCLYYFSENSDRLLDLDSSDKGVKSSLLDKVESIIREPNDNTVSEMIYSLFKKRFSLRYLIISEKVRYTVRKLNFFNLPHNVQFKLLDRLYNAEIGRNNVKIIDDVYSIKVIYQSSLKNVQNYETYKSQTVETQTTILFDLVSQEIRFEVKEMKRYNTDSSKCLIN